MKRPAFLSPASVFCCTLAAALGLGTGWLIHRARVATSVEIKGSDPAGQTVPSAAMKQSASGTSLAAAAEAKNAALAEALATAPRVERWLLLVAAAENAAPDEMPGLLRLCQGDNAALRMVAARWAELAPAHMWQTLQRLTVGTQAVPGKPDASGLGLSTYDLAQLLLESWSPRDQSAVIAALSAAKDFPGIESLRVNMLQPLMKSDPGTALPLLNEWSVRQYYADPGGITEWAEKDPARAAAVVKDCGNGFGPLSALKTVGKAWAKQDPAAALAYAAGLPPVQRAALASGAMKQWAVKDATAAAAYVAALPDAAFRSQLALPLLESWASTAPQQALDWAQDTLRGEARASALGSIVGSMAQQDVTRAAELVSGLDAGGSKNKAVGSLVEQWLQKAGAAPVAEWLLKLPEADAREAGFEKLGFQLLWNSGVDGAAQAAALATGPHAALVPTGFLTQIASDQARRDPEAAMKWADQLPADRLPLIRERVFDEWMQARPEAATEWALARPAGDPHRVLISTAARHFMWDAAPEAAQTFFARLRPADIVLVRELMQTSPLPAERRELMQRVLGRK